MSRRDPSKTAVTVARGRGDTTSQGPTATAEESAPSIDNAKSRD